MQACITAFMISINLLAKTSFSYSPTRKTHSDSQILISYILDIPKTCVQLRCCSLLLVLTTFAGDRWLLNVVFVSLFKSIELQTRLTVQVLRRRIALWRTFFFVGAQYAALAYFVQLQNKKQYSATLRSVAQPSQCCVPRNMCKRNCKKNNNSTSKPKKHV